MKGSSMLLAGILSAGLVLSGCDRSAGSERGKRGPDLAVPEQAHPAFDSLMTAAMQDEWHRLPIGRIVQNVALRFVGAPYEAGLLDRSPVETLVASFETFDCVLLVETAVAAARSIREQDYTYSRYLDNLRSLRYRSGVEDGYCSRLHYFSEWILDNERRGTVRNITAELGGDQLEKRLDFMTTHRGSYPRFAEDDSLYAGIVEMEASLANLKLFYVPQGRIREVYDRLEAGDIIATATSVKGLDVSHSGLVYRDENSVGFLHASTSGGVMVSPDLQRYVENIEIQIGIVVVRPL